MIDPIPFYLLRHGQTDWNRVHRAMGVVDIPLNDLGREQAHQAAVQMAGVPIRTICHSPLKRAQETAHILGHHWQCPCIPIEALREFDLGARAGRVIGAWFDAWMQGSPVPDGETFTQFVNRSIQGVNEALQEAGPVLIVAHGGTYWSIQRGVQQLGWPDLDHCVGVQLTPPDVGSATWRCLHVTGPTDDRSMGFGK